MQQLAPQNPNIAVWPQFCVNGPTTLILQEKAFSFTGDDFRICDQNGVAVVVCQGQGMSLRGRKVSTKMEATFTNAVTGQPTNIYLHGDMFGGFAVLSLGEGGPPIAQITRDFASARDIFINAQTYAVNVAPGVDLALIAVLCIAMDETREAGRR
ncbi:tubby C-terminal-like domain-containing protein [Dioszegia hungarica]|uniref:Tubby C-terminal-like domain-containing protein n=1 Tax=Dioszegia hungarica TaxID=4972 RepID=A0AA38H831_9TREE|nr:tubby C-terminal-like domain-containing protein [Dioszegia hungarica]KAI9635388.1 tubby C-terminal-like domain-containing protein [Dioszegia hungarica]